VRDVDCIVQLSLTGATRRDRIRRQRVQGLLKIELNSIHSKLNAVITNLNSLVSFSLNFSMRLRLLPWSRVSVLTHA
jgi:hypothetical protein